MSMILSRYFFIITLLNTLFYQHLMPVAPFADAAEHQKVQHEDTPFGDAALKEMIIRLTERLPQEQASIAPQLAFLFVLNGIQDLATISDVQLNAYAQQMQEAIKLNEEEIEKGGKSLYTGGPLQEKDRMATIELKSVLAECEKTNAFTPRLSIATAAYLIYRRLFDVHERTMQGKVSWIPTRMIDWSIRLAAFLATGKYKIEKYGLFGQMLWLKSNLGGITPEDQSMMAKLGYESMNDMWNVLKKPDVFNDTLMIPVHMLMNVAPVALYHGMRSLLQHGTAYTTYTKRNCDVLLENTPATTPVKEMFFLEENNNPSHQLVESSLYKQAIVEATGIGVKRAVKSLQKMALRNVDKEKLNQAEKYTLGLLTPQVMADIAKAVIGPVLALSSTDFLREKGVTLVPVLAKHDVGMVDTFSLQRTFTFEGVADVDNFKLDEKYVTALRAPEQEAIKKLQAIPCDTVIHRDKKTQKITVTFIKKGLTELDNLSFAKRRVCETVLSAVGAHVVIRGLRGLVKNRSLLTNGFYSIMHGMAQPFVTLGIMKNNPVHLMTESLRKARVRYLADHYDTFFMLLQLGDAMSRVSQTPLQWTEQQKHTLYTGAEEFGYLMSRMMTQEKDTSLRTPEQNNRLKAFFDTQLVQVVDRVERSGVIGKVIDEVIMASVVHDQSFINHIIAQFGGYLAKKYGMEALRKHALVQ